MEALRGIEALRKYLGAGAAPLGPSFGWPCGATRILLRKIRWG